MGAMDRFLDYLKINEDEIDVEPIDDDEDEDDEDLVIRPKVSGEKVDKGQKIMEQRNLKPRAIDHKPVEKPIKKHLGGEGDVCVIRPKAVEDAREILLTYMENKSIILNLEGLEQKIAQRIIDFIGGACFALDGNLQKISEYIIIITPKNVGVSGDLLDVFTDGILY